MTIDPQHAITLLDQILRDADENGHICETKTLSFLRSQVRPALEEMEKLIDKQVGIEMAQKHLRDLVDCMERIQ